MAAVRTDDVEVRELRYFIAVAEELNFTRAAARLGMAQPPLSAAISKLERKLGVTLLERSTRRVALTSAGAELLEQGRVAVEGVGAAVERTRRRGTQADRLTVAVKPGTGTDLLKEIIRRCAENPRIPAVHPLFGHAGGPAAAVRGGVADVALLHAPFDRRGLDCELLLVEQRVALLSADHPLAGRRELRRRDLAGERMPHWVGERDPAVMAYWTGADTPQSPSPPTERHEDLDPEQAEGPEVSDINQLVDAVALGNAVAYVPISLAIRYQGTGLAMVPVSDLSPSRLVTAWPEVCRSQAVAGFVRTAVDVAADYTETRSAPAGRSPGGSPRPTGDAADVA